MWHLAPTALNRPHTKFFSSISSHASFSKGGVKLQNNRTKLRKKQQQQKTNTIKPNNEHGQVWMGKGGQN